MSLPTNQIVSKQYIEFNQNFEAARREPRASERGKFIQKLVDLQTQIETNAKKASELPGKITFASLPSELAAKIAMLFDKDVKGVPFPPAPTSAPGAWKTKCVGFRNKSANCWANALLQMLLHSDGRTAVLRTVGRFYADGRNLDTPRVDNVIRHFHEGPISDQRFADGQNLFQKITSSFQRLRAIDELITDGRTDVAEQLLRHLPDNYRASIAQLREGKDLKTAVKALINIEMPAEIQKQANMRAAGQAFLAAEQSYRDALRSGIERHQTPTAISNDVSQAVRLAFHFLFGTVNLITGSVVFSPSSGAHEDAYEALQNLMGRYEEILTADDAFPPATYSRLETRRIYQPVGDIRPYNLEKFQKGNYSTLENGTTSRKTTYDYQILVEPPAQNDVPLEDLLARYFRSPPVAGTENGTYLLPDGIHEQDFQPIEVQTSFVGQAPRALTLVIKRFGMRVDGSAYKIQTRVMANRVITLPAEATTANDRPRAYALESFFIHRGGMGGGHYIAYRNMEGTWVEFDDGAVSAFSNEQIDAILQGRRAGDTPYALDYRLVPEERQQEMLRLSQDLRAPRPGPAPGKIVSDHQKLISQLVSLQQLLKARSHSKNIIQVLDAIKSSSPDCYKQLCTLIGIIEGSKDANEGEKALRSRPHVLHVITESWIRASSDDLIGQFIQREKEKMAIRQCNDQIATLKKISSTSTLQTAPILAKKQEEHDGLLKRYWMENLRSLLGLLNNDFITDDQIKAVFNNLQISQPLKNRLFEGIEALSGDPKDKGTGEKQFQAHPRILLKSAKKAEPQASGEDEDALSLLFSNLSLKASSSNILQELIDLLSK